MIIKNVLKRANQLGLRLFFSRENRARKLGMVIGSGTHLFSDCWSSEPYLIRIGRNCQITAGVRLFTHGGAQVLRDEYPDFDVFGKIEIGDWVYIGSNALVMPGVTIGHHVLVAAGSVVTKSIPPGYCVAGNPARCICTLREYLQRNEPYNTHSKGMNFHEKRKFLESLPAEQFVTKSLILPPEK